MRWRERLFVTVAALALLCSLMFALWSHPIIVCCIAVALWALLIVEGRRHDKRLVQWVQARAGESICQFGRAIDCRKVDTWVVRSVYEELQRHHSAKWTLPLRATDRIEEDLGLDWEDLDDVLVYMAQRAGRDLAFTQSNPFFGKIATAGDLVHFLNAQPRIAAAA